MVEAPTHLLFIARSRAKLGLLVEAREAYKKIITANLPENAPKAFLNAQEVAPVELAAIEARLAQLEIVVTGPDGEELSGVVVLINGSELAPALVGVSVPTNPGEVRIEASAEGMASSSRTIKLPEGDEQVVELQLSPTTNDGTTSETEKPAAESSSNERTSSRRTIGWITVGSGAGIALTGGVFGLLSMTQLGRAKSDESLCGAEKLCTSDGRDEVDAARTKALVADISMGVGIAAMAVGTYLIVTGKSRKADVGVRSVSPGVGRHSAYLLLEGGF